MSFVCSKVLGHVICFCKCAINLSYSEHVIVCRGDGMQLLGNISVMCSAVCKCCVVRLMDCGWLAGFLMILSLTFWANPKVEENLFIVKFLVFTFLFNP